MFYDLHKVLCMHISTYYIKTRDSESQGQEETGRT